MIWIRKKIQKKNVNIVENKKEKFYDPIECDSFQMQFGHGMSEIKNNSKYRHKRKYSYPDKRTKKYNAQRPHKGVMGKYKTK